MLTCRRAVPTIPYYLGEGKAFIDRYNKEIVPLERSIVPNHSAPVLIPSISTVSANLSTVTLDDVARRAKPSDYDCSVSATFTSTVAPWTEGTILVRTNLPGLVLITDEIGMKRRQTFNHAF